MARSEIEAIDRGAKDLNLDTVIAAAHKIAIDERLRSSTDTRRSISAVFAKRASTAVSIGDAYEAYPAVVASALNKLRDARGDRPYAVAFRERCYTGLTETAKAGYPILDHVRRIVEA